MANPEAFEVVESGGHGHRANAVLETGGNNADVAEQQQQSAKLLLRRVATRARRSGLRVALGVIFFFGFSSLVLTARSASFSHAWHRSFGSSVASSGGTASGNFNILRHTTRTVVPVLVHSELDQFDSNASATEDNEKNKKANLELRSIEDTEPTTATAAAVPVNAATDQPKAPASPPRYALLRVIGNALPPRHDPARTLKNLRFILENERLDGDTSEELAKHWVINRILDSALLEQIRALLREFNAEFTEIPFDLHAFAQHPYRVVAEGGGIDRVHFESTGDGVTQVKNEWVSVQQQNEIFDAKNRYALSVNAARNVMLDIGKKMGARWIFPWDQNCFLTNEAWRLIKTDLSYQDRLVAQATAAGDNARQFPQLKYFVTPMDRLVQENDVVLLPSYKADPWAEPQIIFREDALERFDERFRYGKRDKVALLVRLKIPGPWSEWGWSRWEKLRTFANLSSDIEGVTVPQTGYVVRLYSGVAGFEVNDKAAAFWRELKRGEAVVSVLNSLEKRVMTELFRFKPESLTVYSTTKLEKMQKEYQEKGSKGTLHGLVTDALQALRVDELWTVTSNAPLDKFKQRNVFSNYFDRPEGGDDAQLIKHMVYNTTALTLVWQITGEPRFAEKAVEALKTWCVNETTLMNPALLDFTDLSHRGLEDDHPSYWVGVASGIRHTVILPYLLDAIRVLFDAETKLAPSVLPAETKRQITTWVAQFYTYLRVAAHPLKKFHSAPSLYGLQYDLQVASMAAFLNDSVAFRYTLGTMQGRLVSMVDAGGHVSVPLGVAQRPYALLSLATWGQALDIAQQLNMTAHLFSFDLTPDRMEERLSVNGSVLAGGEGLLCRLVAKQIPCCDHPESSESFGTGGALWEGACVQMLQSATPADLFIYRRIVRHALSQCPSLEKSWTCASLATIEIANEKLSARELSRYQLPPYPFLYK